MEENNGKVATQSQQTFKCTGDCLNCRAINDRRLQWQYCAAQFTYNTMRMIQSMQESMNAMAGTIEELKAKVNAIQDSEAMVFDPTAESMAIVEDYGNIAAQNTLPTEKVIGDTAQEGSGAT